MRIASAIHKMKEVFTYLYYTPNTIPKAGTSTSDISPGTKMVKSGLPGKPFRYNNTYSSTFPSALKNCVNHFQIKNK